MEEKKRKPTVRLGQELLFTKYSYPHAEAIVTVESISEKTFQTSNGYHFTRSTWACIGSEDAKVEKYDKEKADAMMSRIRRRADELSVLRFFSDSSKVSELSDEDMETLKSLIRNTTLH